MSSAISQDDNTLSSRLPAKGNMHLWAEFAVCRPVLNPDLQQLYPQIKFSNTHLSNDHIYKATNSNLQLKRFILIFVL